MIHTKTKDLFKVLLTAQYHPILADIMFWLCQTFPEKIIVTSAFREGDSGVHGCGRSMDIRAWVFPFPKVIERMINQAWEYDPKRPEMNVAWYHGMEYDPPAPHIHIQCHDRTRRR